MNRQAIGAVLVLLVTMAACKRRPPDELSAEKESKVLTLPALAITDDTTDLMLTWVDAKGDAHVVAKPADVPMEGRDQVRVVVTTKEDGTRDLFYVANLTVKNADGTYPVTTTPRAEWDTLIAKRREELLKANEPAPPVSAAPQAEGLADPAAANAKKPATSFTVVVYGAAWCDACHQAVAFLKRRRVPVVEKDIEADPGAAQEMQAKLARAGIRGGSIPVIDVKGKILIGFEAHALEAAVVGAGGVLL
jgi:glutaredoxin